MSDPATLRVDLLSAILDQVREIIGDDSTASMLHYAAAQEGRILGNEADADLRASLARVEPLVGTALEIVSESNEEIHIRAPGFKENMMDRPVQAILVGLLEGIVSKHRNQPFEGSLNGTASEGIVHLKIAKQKGGDAE